ncbi:MAG: 4-phosphoerythronate dehydrogenase [Aliidiomarina sp.]|uniref:4-phosphoerythronate dehydrogenase n=1 Tax=Aliidiomarina sp. TaxID=1872439 RepID=UPI0025C4BA40|nr:4-phosphoerythronate dehydrogenase [Aliidiomarina sp.]MCH8501413.1 4-phosphoerythronate dehydrogenase [Aliidiomarina sp.]
MKFLIDQNLPKATELLSTLPSYEGVELVFFASRQPPLEHLRDCSVLLVRSITQVNADLLQRAPQLRFVGTATIGTDHIDLAELEQRGIAFASAPGCNAIAVGEYILSALLHVASQRQQILAGKRAVIFGAGHTGREVCQRLVALGLEVRVLDPPLQRQGIAAPPGCQYGDRTDLAGADVISLHVPLTQSGDDSTHHLVNSTLLDELKDDVILLNASRGAVIDNAALLQWRKGRPDVALILDVWEFEPNVDAELVRYCAIATPHIAGHSMEGKIRGTFQLYEEICRWLKVARTSTLADVLPQEPLHSRSLQGEIDQQKVANWVTAVYSVHQDDQEFRKFGLTAAGFDQLRKNYPLRRELSALTIQVSAAKSNQLKALGFRTQAR